ncbi:MAG: carbohydrate kinase family protein [Clostridia bacterium]
MCLLMFDVACAGILVADVIAKPIMNLPEKGTLLPVNTISLHSGGCALSSAVNMSKIGLSTTVLGKVGKDGFADFLIKVMKENGVDTSGLSYDDRLGTSASVVIVGEDSERSFLHYYGANSSFSYEDIDFDIIAESSILFITGVNLMSSFDGIPCSRVLKKAKEMGKTTVLDTAWDATGRWLETIRDSLAHIDYFIPSFDEARMISGTDIPSKMAKVFQSHGVRNVVIKLGREGCYIRDMDGKEHTLSTFDVVPVETTGAGDAFASGFITGLSKGWDIRKCGVFANATGSLSVTSIGASTGIRPLREVIDFIKSQREFEE